MIGPKSDHDVLGVAVFVLQLYRDEFNDDAVCLGPQVASVLDALIAQPELSKATWYAASIDAIGHTRAAFQNYETREPRPIGDVASFVSLVRRTVQFLDGVFFSVPVGQTPNIAVEFLTSDGPIEKLVTNSIAELCAADTSLIWIGTDILTLIERMQERFGGKALQSTANE
jgi:hypothetical protein